MSDKLFGELASIDDLNELAKNLKETNELEEIRTLANENNIDKQKTEDFISGKRNELADDKDMKNDKPSEKSKQSNDKSENKVSKKFASGAEKLAYEEDELMKNVSAGQRDMIKAQFDLVFQELIKRCNENPEFNSLVMQEQKTWERCYKYMEDKARKMAAKGTQSCAVVSTTLFQWIDEYYRIDDKAKLEKEAADKKKAAEDKKKREAEQKDKSQSSKNDTSKKAETTVKPKASVKPEKEEPKAPKKRGAEGQLSLFDFKF